MQIQQLLNPKLNICSFSLFIEQSIPDDISRSTHFYDARSRRDANENDAIDINADDTLPNDHIILKQKTSTWMSLFNFIINFWLHRNTKFSKSFLVENEQRNVTTERLNLLRLD